MRPVPMQVIVTVAKASFVGEVRTERMNVADPERPGVLMECRNEILVRAPDEIRLRNPVEKDPAHHAVLAVGLVVIQSFDGQCSVHRYRWSEREWRREQVPVSDHRSGEFGEQLSGE